jgi:hypothetical protein
MVVIGEQLTAPGERYSQQSSWGVRPQYSGADCGLHRKKHRCGLDQRSAVGGPANGLAGQAFAAASNAKCAASLNSGKFLWWTC